MDYYQVLELKRDCTDVQINAAYRKAALSHHPEKNPSRRAEAQQKFAEAAEAYDVLSNPKLRAIYDRYGLKGLKDGIPDGKGGRTPAYAFTKGPGDVYAQFFGTASGFADVYSGTFRDPDAKEPKRPEPELVNLYCGLEELFVGCTKKQKIVYQKLQADGKSFAAAEKVLSVEVRPGWREGTRVTFPHEGDEQLGAPPADVVFVLREKPHPLFTRKGNDLVFDARVSLSQALTGCTISVQMLDKRVLPVPVTEVVKPGGSKVITGEGMPTPKDPKARGNLVLAFSVDFPTELSVDVKNKLKALLPP